MDSLPTSIASRSGYQTLVKNGRFIASRLEAAVRCSRLLPVPGTDWMFIRWDERGSISLTTFTKRLEGASRLLRPDRPGDSPPDEASPHAVPVVFFTG